MRNTLKCLLVGIATLALLACSNNPNPAAGGTTGTAATSSSTGGGTSGGTTGGGATPAPIPTPGASATPSADATPSASGTPTASGTPAALGTPSPTGTPSASAGTPIKHELRALPGQKVPTLTKKTTLTMTTSAGPIVIEVYPEAAPNAAKRFVELAEAGFYNETPISRVVDGFVAQFGVNWRDPHKQWKENLFDDDPSLFSLDRGTLAFAKAGPNTNSTQVFINFRNNDSLAAQNFTTFGKVVKGMDVVDKFARVGDPNMGLDQGRLWSDGGTYLDSLTDKPTMIETVVVEE